MEEKIVLEQFTRYERENFPEYDNSKYVLSNDSISYIHKKK